MSIATGTRIGHYEIVAPLGAGGMGEVFRARDARLGRDVALKTLPQAFAEDRDRLERFQREARAAGGLQHPGIVAVFDIGTHEGRPYIVSELVDGEPLRALIQRGPLKPARALEIARALADALAAAHARGIVHRDMKPENVMATRDGRIKLLDFGLAKVATREAAGAQEASTQDTSARTIQGTLLGTASYMAPEQARGDASDHRVDLFALGCVLHEMLSGTAPFHRATTVETIAAILKDDAPALPAAAVDALPGIEVVVRACLEKQPADRFESARDLGCALEALRVAAASRGRGEAAPAASRPVADLAFRRLTYRRGHVLSARFTPDGHGVVYAAAWEGGQPELFWVFGGTNESRPLAIKDATLLGISRTSELAIAREFRTVGAFISRGMLARVPLGAGTPRDLQAGIQYADWGPDGQLAVVVEVEGEMRIEYPIGTVVYRSAGGWVSEPRISRDGQRIAFADHPTRGDDSGHVAVIDRDGKVSRLVHYPGTLRGLAWGPEDRDIWHTAAPRGIGRALRAVSLEGANRTLFQIAGSLMLHDVGPDGRVLLAHGDERLGMQTGTIEPHEERDLSWFDWSLLRDITRDGRTVLFDESGEGGGERASIYVRGTDGSPAVRLGDGVGMRFSPDERWVVGLPMMTDRGQVSVLPVGAGSPRTIAMPGHHIHFAGWFPDGESLWVAASRSGESIRSYRLSIRDGAVTPVTEAGMGTFETLVSPDGGSLLLTGPDRGYCLQPLDGGAPREIPGFMPLDRPVRWSNDGLRVLVYERGRIPAQIDWVDVASGEREPWREIGPGDPSGIFTIGPIRVADDFNRYAYTYGRHLTDLFEVQGLP